MHIRPFVIVCLMAALSCSSTPPEEDMLEEEEITDADTVIFLPRVSLGSVTQGLQELSGLALSSLQPGYFWTHNDSGDGPYLYCLSHKGERVRTDTLTGVTHRDWEDITSGKDPSTGRALLFLADIGDNTAAFTFKTIYVLEEGVLTSGLPSVGRLAGRITFRYADGNRDAETLLFDPLTGDLWVVSKREERVGLYHIPYPFRFQDTLTLEKVSELPVTQIVAGAVSSTGKDIALKNYTTVYYWRRKSGQSIAEALAGPYMLTSYTPEPQGEALCWEADGSAFYTVSEAGPFAIRPVLYRYEKAP